MDSSNKGTNLQKSMIFHPAEWQEMGELSPQTQQHWKHCPDSCSYRKLEFWFCVISETKQLLIYQELMYHQPQISRRFQCARSHSHTVCPEGSLLLAKQKREAVKRSWAAELQKDEEISRSYEVHLRALVFTFQIRSLTKRNLQFNPFSMVPVCAEERGKKGSDSNFLQVRSIPLCHLYCQYRFVFCTALDTINWISSITGEHPRQVDY